MDRATCWGTVKVGRGYAQQVKLDGDTVRVSGVPVAWIGGRVLVIRTVSRQWRLARLVVGHLLRVARRSGVSVKIVSVGRRQQVARIAGRKVVEYDYGKCKR